MYFSQSLFVNENTFESHFFELLTRDHVHCFITKKNYFQKPRKKIDVSSSEDEGARYEETDEDGQLVMILDDLNGDINLDE